MVAFGVLQRHGRGRERRGRSNSERGTVSTVPCDRMTARSITFCSSRTLPGHGQRHSISRLCGRPIRWAAAPFGEPLREVADEQRNVLEAFPQRRNPDWKNVQPVGQVRTELRLATISSRLRLVAAMSRKSTRTVRVLPNRSISRC